MHTYAQSCGHTHANMRTLAYVTRSGLPGDYYSITKCGSEMSEHLSLSLVLSHLLYSRWRYNCYFFWILSSTPILRLISTLSLRFTHKPRQMNINSLNQCFFLGHQSYLCFLASLLRCEMTDFCLAVLREETIQLCFKGTIFREGV